MSTSPAAQDRDQIRALSLSRPYTELVLSGVKNIENRTFSTTYRGPLIIHGARSYRPDAIDLVSQIRASGMFIDSQLDILAALDLTNTCPTGYLGAVDVLRTCPGECFSCGPWAIQGVHHWKIGNPRRFPTPIEQPGRLGLFTPSPEALVALHGIGAAL